MRKWRRKTLKERHTSRNLSLNDARMRFRVAAKMVPTVLANHPSKHRRAGRPITCPSCTGPGSAVPGTPPGPGTAHSQPLHSQSHILTSCPAVLDLRAECDPEDDASLATFFRRVVARHMELEERVEENE